MSKNQVKDAAIDLEAVIRQAVISEIGQKAEENKEALERLQQEISFVEGSIAEAESKARYWADRVREAHGKLKELKALKKEFEADEEVINQRVNAALAALRGESLKKSPRKPGTPKVSSAKARNVEFDITIDGKPRSFVDFTKLTFWLNQRGSGEHVYSHTIYDEFERQTGIRLGSAEHEAAGMIHATIRGFDVGMAVRKAASVE
ncbi:MAG: hypothetical protein JJ714_11445 [Acidithiobacillus sp.]|nr:hypothetical protein [Acidithiobacillus sp.]